MDECDHRFNYERDERRHELQQRDDFYEEPHQRQSMHKEKQASYSYEDHDKAYKRKYDEYSNEGETTKTYKRRNEEYCDGCEYADSSSYEIKRGRFSRPIKYQKSTRSPIASISIAWPIEEAMESNHYSYNNASNMGEKKFDASPEYSESHLYGNSNTNYDCSLGRGKQLTNSQLYTHEKHDSDYVSVTSNINPADYSFVDGKYSTITENYNSGEHETMLNSPTMSQKHPKYSFGNSTQSTNSHIYTMENLRTDDPLDVYPGSYEGMKCSTDTEIYTTENHTAEKYGNVLSSSSKAECSQTTVKKTDININMVIVSDCSWNFTPENADMVIEKISDVFEDWIMKTSTSNITFQGRPKYMPHRSHIQIKCSDELSADWLIHTVNKIDPLWEGGKFTAKRLSELPTLVKCGIFFYKYNRDIQTLMKALMILNPHYKINEWNLQECKLENGSLFLNVKIPENIVTEQILPNKCKVYYRLGSARLKFYSPKGELLSDFIPGTSSTTPVHKNGNHSTRESNQCGAAISKFGIPELDFLFRQTRRKFNKANNTMNYDDWENYKTSQAEYKKALRRHGIKKQCAHKKQ